MFYFTMALCFNQCINHCKPGRTAAKPKTVLQNQHMELKLRSNTRSKFYISERTVIIRNQFLSTGINLSRVLTYCWAQWLKWAVSAGWSVCEGSERSRCSHSWCLLAERWKSTSLRSGPGTLVCPAAAFESLKDREREWFRCENKDQFISSLLDFTFSLGS